MARQTSYISIYLPIYVFYIEDRKKKRSKIITDENRIISPNCSPHKFQLVREHGEATPGPDCVLIGAFLKVNDNALDITSISKTIS